MKAIESGKFEVLPSTYIRLFLKAYCVEIGADPVDALRQMNILLGAEEPEVLPVTAEETLVEENGEPDDGAGSIAMDHHPHEIRSDWFLFSNSVGICGATSTPLWLMERVSEFISKIK